MIRHSYLLPGMLVLLAGFCVLPSAARAAELLTIGGACTSNRDAADWDGIDDCVSSLWVRSPLFVGSSSASCTTGLAGMVQWTGSAFQVCTGSVWANIITQTSVTPPTVTGVSGTGYFVLSSATFTGNLGGMNQADALCLTDLTNNNWLGKSAAVTAGQMIASKVHAFLTNVPNNPSYADNLDPLVTYDFAVSGNVAIGGATFTTDSSGQGPNDSDTWTDSTHFGGTYNYWTNRTTNNSTQWGTSWGECCPGTGTAICRGSSNLAWTSSSASDTGAVGNSNNTNGSRWDTGAGTTTCNTAENLICFVNP